MKLRIVEIASNLKVAFGMLVLAAGVAVASPQPAIASLCGPGGPATNCPPCGGGPAGFEPCGCCAMADGSPTCLYCLVE